MKKSFLRFLCIGLTLCGPLHGYGNAGHLAVGTIAAHYLEGTRAGDEVKSLLKKDGLDRAATWADRAKIPEKYLTVEMKEFVANNPNHHSFHYCDIPFQQPAYREGLTGTNPNDIVHVLRICVEVLQSPDAHPKNPLKLSKHVALMLIAHYIGDLHQPLHVGCSYVDENNHFIDPETGAKGQLDAGGNHFHLTSSTTLHSYWDTQTVKAAIGRAGTMDFPSYLISKFPPQPEWEGKGGVGTWPEQWATDTLGLAKQCFEGIELHDRYLVPDDGKHEEHFEWKVTLPAGYAEKSRDIVELELAKAGYRLAAILKGVWPELK